MVWRILSLCSNSSHKTYSEQQTSAGIRNSVPVWCRTLCTTCTSRHQGEPVTLCARTLSHALPPRASARRRNLRRRPLLALGRRRKPLVGNASVRRGEPVDALHRGHVSPCTRLSRVHTLARTLACTPAADALCAGATFSLSYGGDNRSSRPRVSDAADQSHSRRRQRSARSSGTFPRATVDPRSTHIGHPPDPAYYTTPTYIKARATTRWGPTPTSSTTVHITPLDVASRATHSPTWG